MPNKPHVPMLKTLLKRIEYHCAAASRIDASLRLRNHIAETRNLIRAARTRLDEEEPAIKEVRQRLSFKRYREKAVEKRKRGRPRIKARSEKVARKKTIADTLAEIMEGMHRITTSEAMEALQAKGYLTRTSYPRDAANHILRSNPRSRKVGHGEYALAERSVRAARMPDKADIDSDDYEDDDEEGSI